MASTYTDHSIKKILDLTYTDTCPPKDTEEHIPLRVRRRTLFSARALDKMEDMFERNPYPDVETREKLSQEFGVSESKIQVWFQNRRTRRGRTKSRRGPCTATDLKTAKKQKQQQADNHLSLPMPLLYPITPYPHPALMVSGKLLMTPLPDYSPHVWKNTWSHIQQSTARPGNKLNELLLEELRSYETNSSGSTTEDSVGDL